MEATDWNVSMRGPRDVISEGEDRGIVRTHGAACHPLAALKTAASEPWVEVDLARLNPARIAMDSDPETVISVLREMKRNGKGVVGMKILGQGTLRDKPDECLQFALAAGCLDCFPIGSETPPHMEHLHPNIPPATF